MTTLPYQAPFSLMLARLGRLFPPAPHNGPGAPSLDDPMFLPDFATLTPDQAQELRLGLGRHHSRALRNHQ